MNNLTNLPLTMTKLNKAQMIMNKLNDAPCLTFSKFASKKQKNFNVTVPGDVKCRFKFWVDLNFIFLENYSRAQDYILKEY